MRALLLLLGACGSATPRTAPRIGELPGATCTIAGARASVFDVRHGGVAIARIEADVHTVRLRGDDRRAVATLSTQAYEYRGEVVLSDVRASLVRPVNRGDLTVSLVSIERISGATALVRPAPDARVQLTAPASFTVACDELRFDDGPVHADRLATAMPLLVGQPVRLFTTPGGDEVAMLTVGDCKTDLVEAHLLHTRDQFSRVRIPTAFGELHAWADSPSLLDATKGIPWCGDTGNLGTHFRVGGRFCPRRVPLFVDRGGVVEVGAIAPGTRIVPVRTAGGRGELTERQTDKLTPFVHLADIADCPAGVPR